MVRSNALACVLVFTVACSSQKTATEPAAAPLPPQPWAITFAPACPISDIFSFRVAVWYKYKFNYIQ